jgi:hypothetical protein
MIPKEPTAIAREALVSSAEAFCAISLAYKRISNTTQAKEITIFERKKIRRVLI